MIDNRIMKHKDVIISHLKKQKLKPTNQITVGCNGFLLQSSEAEKRVAIHKLAKSLAPRIWKKLDKRRYPIDDEFKYIIIPERFGKSSINIGWHLHIILFLTPEEKIIYKLHREAINHIINNQCSKFFRSIDLKSSFVKNYGFVDYALKHCEDSFDILVSNAL
jgi:hypothetical protein